MPFSIFILTSMSIPMFFAKRKKEMEAMRQKLQAAQDFIDAVNTNNAVIEFEPDGTILDANDAFLAIVGYHKQEIVGKHHRMFCTQDYINSPDYKNFWSNLKSGQFKAGSFQRVTKQGEKVWLRATYFPVSHDNQVYKVVKFAQDVTVATLQRMEQEAILSALDKSLAVIEFTPTGEILNANENFLRTVGYSLDEIRGKHHRILCNDDFYRSQPHFWDDLAKGQFSAGKFERVSHSGQRIFLEATYNPIFNDAGRVKRVIKFASDITAQVEHDEAVREASQVAYETSARTVDVSKECSGMLKNSVQISASISEKISNATNLIRQLHDKSGDISDIVNTISSIAEQTNLLALNAAIEAARAGEHGRGFAVVADEVRGLAARTNSSTIEIEELVKANEGLTENSMKVMNDIQEQAESAGTQINKAAEVIEEISEGAENVTQTVATLADKRNR
jgi:methyl-accepting chemotaxis protein